MNNNILKTEINQMSITERVKEDIEKSKNDLIEVSSNIKQLNRYINGDLKFSNKKLETILYKLIQNFTWILIYELNTNTILRRARKFEENDLSNPYFHTTNELSYIRDEKIVLQGRLNKKNQAMYYGVISHSKYNRYDTALSEIDAYEYERVNLLDSKVIEPITTLHIGAFHLYMTGQKIPTWVHPLNKDIYKIFIDECDKNNNHYLLESYTLCAAFFYDIFSRKNHGNLYDVTSAIASMLLEHPDVNSIVYESVQVQGAPSIAIKPRVIDKKIVHETTQSAKVVSSLGYGLYYCQDNIPGIVNDDQTINWKKSD